MHLLTRSAACEQVRGAPWQSRARHSKDLAAEWDRQRVVGSTNVK